MSITFEEIPSLETKRLILRGMAKTDANAVFRIFSDEEVMKYYEIDPLTEVGQAQSWIEGSKHRFASKGLARWGITLKGENTVLGTGGYVGWNKSSFCGEISYDLARMYWNRGIMTEAVRAIVQFGFEYMNLNRIQAIVVSENIASLHLLEKLGFQEEGILRELEFWRGAFRNVRIISLLKRDYKVIEQTWPRLSLLPITQ